MLREIVQHIDNQTSLTTGTDLFCGWRPETAPDRCVTVLEPTGPQENFYISGRVDKPVQVLTRSTSYDQAKSDAEAVVALFIGQGKAGTTLPVLTSGESYLVHTATTISGPAGVGQDHLGRHEFVANILLRTQLN